MSFIFAPYLCTIGNMKNYFRYWKYGKNVHIFMVLA